jgi:hypothetical protein
MNRLDDAAFAHRLIIFFVPRIVADRIIVCSLQETVVMSGYQSRVVLDGYLAFNLIENELQLPCDALLRHLFNTPR